MRRRRNLHTYPTIIAIDKPRQVVGTTLGMYTDTFNSESDARSHAAMIQRSTGSRPRILWVRIDIETGIVTTAQELDSETSNAGSPG